MCIRKMLYKFDYLTMNFSMYVVLLAIIIIAALMIIDVTYFLSGSFELYPTEEQERNVKLVTGMIFFVLFIIEAILVVLNRSVNT